jgi:peptidyl-prolyl cis-trans isomerase SurA
VVLKVTQHDKAGPAPMKNVEVQIENGLYMQQMEPALRAYLSKLRDDAYVDIQPGFVDSGATPNESKPLFTAYAPPTPKKKEEHAVTRFDRSGSAKPVIASPDTTGTRTITGADAQPAIDPVTGLASIKAPVAPKGTNGRKTRREKIRFGQAPRNAIPAGTDQVAGDLPAASAPAAGGVKIPSVAPGAVMASNGTTPSAPESVNLDDNPLTPRAPVEKKTRFASKEKEVRAAKAAQAMLPTAKEKEKLLAKPVAMTAEEKATAQTQAAPLGLGGDTTKKPVKPKRVKGQPKQRLEDKPADAKPATPAAPAPTVNPNLAPTGIPPATPPPS